MSKFAAKILLVSVTTASGVSVSARVREGGPGSNDAMQPDTSQKSDTATLLDPADTNQKSHTAEQLDLTDTSQKSHTAEQLDLTETRQKSDTATLLDPTVSDVLSEASVQAEVSDVLSDQTVKAEASDVGETTGKAEATTNETKKTWYEKVAGHYIVKTGSNATKKGAKMALQGVRHMLGEMPETRDILLSAFFDIRHEVLTPYMSWKEWCAEDKWKASKSVITPGFARCTKLEKWPVQWRDWNRDQQLTFLIKLDQKALEDTVGNEQDQASEDHGSEVAVKSIQQDRGIDMAWKQWRDDLDSKVYEDGPDQVFDSLCKLSSKSRDPKEGEASVGGHGKRNEDRIRRVPTADVAVRLGQ